MADYIHPDVLDTGLQDLPADAENLYLCSQQPTTFAEAVSYKLGTKAAPSISAPQAGVPDGRQVTVSAITDGVVDAAGDANSYAIVDNSASKLLATGDLQTPQTLTPPNTFTLTSFTIRIPPAVA